MKVSLYIAWRYLFARKSQNAINIISGIAVLVVAICTMALVILLSVFNGLEQLVVSLFNSFDPDIKITATQGKTFVLSEQQLEQIKNIEGVAYYSQTLEENALLEYSGQQFLATIKGVDNNFGNVTGIDSMLTDGKFELNNGNTPTAVLGGYVAHYLSVGLHIIDPLKVYVPKRTAEHTSDLSRAFHRKVVYPAGVFSIQQEFDAKYVLVSISFARELLEYTNEVSAVEIKLNKDITDRQRNIIQQQIADITGTGYNVQNRYEQQALLYKIMQSEKWAIFMILSFILVIASFSIVGALTMLIIEKKNDIAVLQSMGADRRLIHRVFLTEGWLIAMLGGIIGMCIGLAICWLQIRYGFIGFPGSSVIAAYPVQIIATDLLYVFGIVFFIGTVTAWYPANNIAKRYMFLK